MSKTFSIEELTERVIQLEAEVKRLQDEVTSLRSSYASSAKNENALRLKENRTVVYTERGLTIAGTRITLYDVMDYVVKSYPPVFIKDIFNLTDQQVTDVMDYINTHREEVEREYEIVLKNAEEHRQYWEERNRERFAQIAAMPPTPGKEELYAKLQAWKEKIRKNESAL